MEYRQKSPDSLHNDHENSDYILTNGLAPELVQRAMHLLDNRENMLDTARFNSMLEILGEQIQQPRPPRDQEFAGYTGHRLITLDDPDIQYALNFYVQFWVVGKEKTIVAQWRRVYDADDRRTEREISEKVFKSSQIASARFDGHGQLLQLESLFEKYMQAAPYGDPQEYPTAS